MKIKSTIANSYKSFLDTLYNKKIENKDIAKQIFFDMFYIRLNLWEYKHKVNRGKDFTLAEIFQDIIAHYLRKKLGKEYEILLEKKKDKCMPDIIVKKEGVYWSIIEIKTTIGWNRDLIYNYKKEIQKLYREFKVRRERIFFILESYQNMNSERQKIFEDQSNEINRDMLPLFKYSPSPYYLIENKEFSRIIFSKDMEELLNEIKRKEGKNVRKLTKERILGIRNFNYIKKRFNDKLVEKLYDKCINKKVNFDEIIRKIRSN